TVEAAPVLDPAISVSPDALAFDDTLVGEASDPQSVTVTNTGGGTLTGSAVTGGPFAILGNADYTLAADQSMEIEIVFVPALALTAPGDVVFTIAGGYPVVVTLGQGPFYMEVCESFHKDITSQRLLHNSSVAPIDIRSCFDLELLSSYLRNDGSLTDLISDLMMLQNGVTFSIAMKE
ncbi:MAG: hypothetical protein IIC84_05470, partial [Chloroflexi bacterium]|nr:hypothetical protein [Chloroflexota bacterium]